MMKTRLHLALLALPLCGLQAQTYDQVSVGTGYTEQAFYDLETGTSVQVANESWDLAFTTFGFQDAGIHVNESTSATYLVDAPRLELYAAGTTDFESVLAFEDTYERLYNDEKSWTYGALNASRATTDPFDYGWGSYNPAARGVQGSKVFLVKLRDGNWKKFMVESLAVTTYNLRYADLDGSNEQRVSFDKAGFEDGLAFFSFETGEAVDLGVGSFDLAFMRYVSPATYQEQFIPDYAVTGFLAGLDLEVAQIEDIDPKDVNMSNMSAAFETDLDIIGYDWKTYDFESDWMMSTDLCYLAKTKEGMVYKLVMIDFEGQETGVATIEKTEMGVVSSIHDLDSAFDDVAVFPNPTQGDLTVSYSLKEAAYDVQIVLSNALGQRVWAATTSGRAGFNAKEVALPVLPSGNYALSIHAGASVTTQLVAIQ